jgi:hypothetical protein
MKSRFVNLPEAEELFRRNDIRGAFSHSIYGGLRSEFDISPAYANRLATLFAGVKWLQTELPVNNVKCDNCRMPMPDTRKRHGMKQSYHICHACQVENED